LIKYFLVFLWQAPQNLLALLLIVVCRARRAGSYRNKYLYTYRLKAGVSLGCFIFIGEHRGDSHRVVKHEYGHCVQSELLGPLYLLIIGVASFTMNALTRVGVLSCERYYKRWPESWADRLGGVLRC
jgi:hypothetical protein